MRDACCSRRCIPPILLAVNGVRPPPSPAMTAGTLVMHGVLPRTRPADREHTDRDDRARHLGAECCSPGCSACNRDPAVASGVATRRPAAASDLRHDAQLPRSLRQRGAFDHRPPRDPPRRAARAAQALAATTALGALFLGVQGVEWSRLIHHGLTLGSSQYGGRLLRPDRLPRRHVLAAVMWLSTVTLLAFREHYRADAYAGLEMCAIYWYFVAALWGVLFSGRLPVLTS